MAEGGRFVVVEASERGEMSFALGVGGEVCWVLFIVGSLGFEMVVELGTFLSVFVGGIAGFGLGAVFLSMIEV